MTLNRPQIIKQYRTLQPFRIKLFNLNHLELTGITYLSAHGASITDIRAATATDRLHASNVGDNTAVRLAQKVKIPQQNVRCVAGIIPPTTKAARATIISSEVTTPIEPPKLVSTHNPRNLLPKSHTVQLHHNNHNNHVPMRM